MPRTKRSLAPPRWWVARWLESVTRDGRAGAAAARARLRARRTGRGSGRSSPGCWRRGSGAAGRRRTGSRCACRPSTSRSGGGRSGGWPSGPSTTAALLVGELPESAEAALRGARGLALPRRRGAGRDLLLLPGLAAALQARDGAVPPDRGPARDRPVRAVHAARALARRAAGRPAGGSGGQRPERRRGRGRGRPGRPTRRPRSWPRWSTASGRCRRPGRPRPRRRRRRRRAGCRRRRPRSAGALLRQELATAYGVMRERAGRLGRRRRSVVRGPGDHPPRARLLSS